MDGTEKHKQLHHSSTPEYIIRGPLLKLCDMKCLFQGVKFTVSAWDIMQGSGCDTVCPCVSTGWEPSPFTKIKSKHRRPASTHPRQLIQLIQWRSNSNSAPTLQFDVCKGLRRCLTSMLKRTPTAPIPWRETGKNVCIVIAISKTIYKPHGTHRIQEVGAVSAKQGKTPCRRYI